MRKRYKDLIFLSIPKKKCFLWCSICKIIAISCEINQHDDILFQKRLLTEVTMLFFIDKNIMTWREYLRKNFLLTKKSYTLSSHTFNFYLIFFFFVFVIYFFYKRFHYFSGFILVKISIEKEWFSIRMNLNFIFFVLAEIFIFDLVISISKCHGWIYVVISKWYVLIKRNFDYFTKSIWSWYCHHEYSMEI